LHVHDLNKPIGDSNAVRHDQWWYHQNSAVADACRIIAKLQIDLVGSGSHASTVRRGQPQFR
jgi:hypothetical protein